LPPAFAARVRGEVETVSARHPGISISIARPDLVNPAPQRGITTCEQNPWDTAHVLADGAVVVCEVQDRVEIGNLQQQTLREIWNGSKYRDFRRQYLNGTHPACARCPWRRTLLPLAGKKVLVRGWHSSCNETVEWSEASAAAALLLPPGSTGIRVAGILPPPPVGIARNSLTIRGETGATVQIVNATEALLAFEAVLPNTSRRVPRTTALRFETQHPFRPADRGQGPDLRNLGFALTHLSALCGEGRNKSVRRLLDQLQRIDRIVAVVQPVVRQTIMEASVTPAGGGVSLVIPARDTPDLLIPTLALAEAAMARIEETSELVIVVSGADAAAYAGLRRSFPFARWIFRAEALDFGAAIELGIASAKHPWVYLLNSDMHLRPEALAEVMKLRRWDTFAVGSRIKMEDGSNTETNWTDLRFHESDAAELIERDPADVREPRGSLYVGGGSGLFRASLLKRFLKRTRAYRPFYWEDVEWGALAWRSGYQCTFCPASEAVHGRRKTVARYYTESEVSRVFERNRLLFHLRNLGGVRCLESRLLSLDPQSWADIFHSRGLLDTAWARATAFLAPRKQEVLLNRWKISL